MVQKVSGDMLDAGALSELQTNYTPTNYLRVAANGTLEQRTPAQVRADIGAGTGGGTVTSVAVADATGITWTGSPITGAGTLTPALSANLQAWSGLTTASKQAADADLAAIAALASTGIAARTAADTWTTRTITGPASGLTVTNGGGVAGNPTLALANDLAAVEGLAANGLAARTATDTWAVRTATGTTNRLTVTNGDGVAGNPTFDVSTSYAGQATITTLGTVTTGTWSATTIAANRGGTGLAAFTAGNYLNAATTSTLQERTPTQVRTDLAITTSSSGTYTPTIASIANTTVNSAQAFQWLRVGNTVTVSGRVTVTPTAPATSTEVSLTLPVASATTLLEQVAGTGMDFTAVVPGLVFGDPTSDTARFRFRSIGTTSTDFVLHYTYQVL